MLLSALLNAFAVGVGVFLSLELHRKIEKKREENGGVLPLPWNPLEEKAEYLPPMDEEEYTKYMADSSSRGRLLTKILTKAPWTSKRTDSQSSDS